MFWISPHLPYQFSWRIENTGDHNLAFILGVALLGHFVSPWDRAIACYDW
ncbi:hypothetical protein [Nostoc sp. MS1]|nr:hypothetical protein [Nostoc sp. MS1]